MFALLLAYGSQLMAAVQPCAMGEGQSHGGEPVMQGMAAAAMTDAHAHHAMPDAAQEDVTSTSTCCDNSLGCDMSQCGIPFGLVQQVPITFPLTQVHADFAWLELLPAHVGDNLYHPPRLT